MKFQSFFLCKDKLKKKIACNVLHSIVNLYFMLMESILYKKQDIKYILKDTKVFDGALLQVTRTRPNI